MAQGKKGEAEIKRQESLLTAQSLTEDMRRFGLFSCHLHPALAHPPLFLHFDHAAEQTRLFLGYTSAFVNVHLVDLNNESLPMPKRLNARRNFARELICRIFL